MGNCRFSVSMGGCEFRNLLCQCIGSEPQLILFIAKTNEIRKAHLHKDEVPSSLSIYTVLGI